VTIIDDGLLNKSSARALETLLLSIVLFTLTSFNRQQKEKDGVWELG